MSRWMTAVRFEHECGLVRVQAVNQGEDMLDKVEAALGVASRHLKRFRAGTLPLSDAVVEEIEASIERARALVGVDQGSRSDGNEPPNSSRAQ